MFVEVAGNPVDYNDPWDLSYFERRRAYVRADRHIAYVYERPDTSTFRYRVFNMVESLAANPGLGISASWFTLEEISRSLEFLDHADAVVICRTRYDDKVARLIARARARGTKVIFDIDDFVFDPDNVQLITETLDLRLRNEEDWNFWFGSCARLGATLRQCDAAIGTNAFLQAQMESFSPGTPTAVVPNFLNRLQTDMSRTLLFRKRRTRFRRDGWLDIGYFSGTPSHNRDLLVAAPALASVLTRFPRVRLRIVGFMQLNEYLKPLESRLRLVPLQDYLNLQRVTADVEVAVAPLQSNVFTNCKSELKYFEAGIVGVPVIATPSFTFAQSIRDGVNGFLARAHEWEEKICGAIDLVESRFDEYEAICDRAAAHSEQTYGWDSFGPRIAEAVFGTA